ncbi:sensor histidine kinase [uncultured Kordia sp.]|uniref:sensor histidine kinase n=1 Tax=uncultured Kordia sp. TaxID=507699 RepID=UPI0026270070|nr:sensor histidine kinase [uncultured Kordia sp.]
METISIKKTILIHAFILVSISVCIAMGFSIATWETLSITTFLIYFLQASSSIILLLAPAIYLKVYWLIPTYLVPKKYIQYTIFLVLLVVVWGLFIGTVEPWIDEHWFHEIDEKKTTPFNGVFAMAFIMLVTTLLNLSYRWFTQLSKIKQIENDRLQLELSLLRNQINPHFFFNTLNNLYALSLEKSDQTSEVILKLSEMMRYTIYDCKENTVAITSEVSYLENFITLQKMRHHNRGQIRFEKEITNDRLQVAPMILIVFLENAFKHGFDLLEKDAFLNSKLTVKESFLHFFIENNFNEEDQNNSVGIGLENVKRRLSLIYPNTHELHITNSAPVFRVDLKLQL